MFFDVVCVGLAAKIDHRNMGTGGKVNGIRINRPMPPTDTAHTRPCQPVDAVQIVQNVDVHEPTAPSSGISRRTWEYSPRPVGMNAAARNADTRDTAHGNHMKAIPPYRISHGWHDRQKEPACQNHAFLIPPTRHSTISGTCVQSSNANPRPDRSARSHWGRL